MGQITTFLPNKLGIKPNKYFKHTFSKIIFKFKQLNVENMFMYYFYFFNSTFMHLFKYLNIY